MSQDATPRVRHFLAAQKLLEFAKATPEYGLTYRPIALDTAIILNFGDSSWANALGLKSQGGLSCTLTTPAALTSAGAAFSLLDYRSYRIKRVCRSTLGAETAAMDQAVDHGCYIRKALAELLCPGYRATGGDPEEGLLACFVVTDCKSLFDRLTKLSAPGGTDEKRVAVDICAIKEQAQPRQIRWAPTHSQLADHFTKAISPIELAALLEAGHIRVSEQGAPRAAAAANRIS